MANLFLLISFLYFVVSFLLNSPDNMRMAYLILNLWMIAKIFGREKEHTHDEDDDDIHTFSEVDGGFDD